MMQPAANEEQLSILAQFKLCKILEFNGGHKERYAKKTSQHREHKLRTCFFLT